MAKAKTPRALVRGYWFIHSGLAGEIERAFERHAVIDACDLARELANVIEVHQWIIRDGDTIRVQAGEGPSDE